MEKFLVSKNGIENEREKFCIGIPHRAARLKKWLTRMESTQKTRLRSFEPRGSLYTGGGGGGGGGGGTVSVLPRIVSPLSAWCPHNIKIARMPAPA